MSHEFGVGEYKTRGGGDAVIFGRHAMPNGDALIGVIRSRNKGWHLASWRTDGSYVAGEPDPCDLMPPDRSEYVNMDIRRLCVSSPTPKPICIVGYHTIRFTYDGDTGKLKDVCLYSEEGAELP